MPRHHGLGALAGAAEADDRDIAERRSSSNTTRAPSAQQGPNAPLNFGWVDPRPILPVGEADALGDRVWFAQHPTRSFRSRRGADGAMWITRRSGDALLRVLIPPTLFSPVRESDGELGPLWFAAAWPSLSVEKAQQLGRRAARQGRRGRS
jgi:hypothetical protein